MAKKKSDDSFQHMDNVQLPILCHFLYLWLKIDDNLARTRITTTERSAFTALFSTYNTAVDTYRHGNENYNHANLLDLNEARKAVEQWLSDYFVPYIYANTDITNKEISSLGYHARPAAATYEHPFLNAEITGEMEVEDLHRIFLRYRYQVGSHPGLPAGALYLTLQYVDITDRKDETHPIVNDEDWITYGNYTKVNKGIRIEYPEEMQAHVILFRARWANHKDTSGWSESIRAVIN